MHEDVDHKITSRPAARCADCDREKTHYNVFLLPDNDERVVCWECLQRMEKGFFAKRDFGRGSRRGYIPR